jgi:hypothetical protein
MRLLILPLALLAASQAHAQDRALPRDVTVEQVGEALSNPMVQTGIAGLVGAFANTLLDTHVGPLAHYTDPRDGIRAQDTVGDLVRRSDPQFDARLQRQSRNAVAATGQAARDAAAMSRELSKTAGRLRELLAMTSAAVEAADRQYRR